MKDLVEVIHSYQHLVGQARRERGVQNHRVVEYVDGSDFEIVFQIGAGRSQRRAGTQRRSLVALSSKPMGRKVVLVGQVVVEFDGAVVAIARGCNRAEEVVECSRQATDQAPRPKPIRAD